ncbi:MAG: Plug domain-containing protein, partial [Deltaproteobacteria bacterium]|nr:Plug domain-containing protein [Deltaproteobacteria bacterium]
MVPSICRAVADAAPVFACLGLVLSAVTVASPGARAGVDADVFVIAQNAAPVAEAEEEDFDPRTGSSSAEPPSDVEVIRIKGRGIQAIETDVPQSVTQFDAAEIEALGAQDISTLADVTPNVEIRTAGATSPVFFIRGVGLSDFSANASGAVAIYQDDVPINAPAMQLGLIYDLENVEILRGPQGKGSNRNASAGVFKLISRKPTGELSAGLRAEGGKYGLQDYDGFIEVPIVEEILSARFAFRLRQRDGYVTNDCTGADSFESRLTVSDPGDLPNDGKNALPGFLQDSKRLQQYCAPEGASVRNVMGEVLVAKVKNNHAQTPNPNDPNNNPPPAFFNHPNTIGFNVSDISGGNKLWSIVPPDLPSKVNDQDRWAARGIFRLTPPDLDMEWLVKAHGSRLDQMSTLGQSIPSNGSIYGCAQPDKGYLDRDILKLMPAGSIATATCQRNPTTEALQKKLAEDLDTDPWRGDFNRVGQTTLDIWGTSIIGSGKLGPVNLKAVAGYDQYERFRDQDNDFSPNIVFESLVEDEGHQWFTELNLNGELTETPFRWNVGGYYLT